MIMNLGKQAIGCFIALLLMFTSATAQTAAPAKDAAKPAAATAAPATAAATETPAAPKAAPALPQGSTAGVGWNNPPKWSDVEQKPQYASVPGREMNVLVEDNGQAWRALRNGPVTFYGGVLLLVAPSLLLLFFFIKGPFKLHDTPTGRLVERFNSAERMTHWTVAISFVLLAVTGIIILFGKYVLLPILGASVFSMITLIGKNIHNFVGPLFMFSLVVMFFLYVKDNFFSGADFTWLAKLGGLLSGNHTPAGRFNGGEKAWFWIGVVVLGLTVSVSGLIMLFPNWNSARELMAQANLVHAGGAILFATLAFAHIYLGTIGTEGAYQGMREGYVDETWAKEHHSLWYDDVKAGKRTEKIAGTVQPAAGDD
jgi:formate dehydrogenase subunit gamma